MISLIFTCGIGNFALGFLLALVFSRAEGVSLDFGKWKDSAPLKWLNFRSVLAIASRLRGKSVQPELAIEEEAPAEPVVEEPPKRTPSERAAEILNAVPPNWREAVATAELPPLSFPEAAAHWLLLEALKFREQLLTAEGAARGLQNDSDSAAIAQAIADVRAFSTDWLTMERTTAEQVNAQRGRLANYEEEGQSLEDILFDQVGVIESSISTLNALDPQHDSATASNGLLIELARLTDGANSLRDYLQELLSTFVRAEERQSELSTASQLDPSSGLLNRLGLERLIWDWQAEDPTHQRPATMCLLDLDRFAKMNERLGPRMGDRLITGFCGELEQFLRQDRGFDRLVRIGWDRLLLFLGDTTAQQGWACAERIRQSVEAMTFHCNGTAVEMTISASVREWKHPERAIDSIARLKKLLLEAKQGGRNRVILEERGTKVVCESPRYPIQARSIKVD